MVVSLPLFLSDIGGGEIFLILLVVLIFFGSKGIPGIARTLGKTVRQIKDASEEVQNEIRKTTQDVRSDFNLQNVMNDTIRDIEKPLKEEAVKLDQVIQTPTQFSQPFGVRPPQPAVSSENTVSEPLKESTPETNSQSDSVLRSQTASETPENSADSPSGKSEA